jgi:regulator of protease activity HflC (stomatin/prohibitin superfamily)
MFPYDITGVDDSDQFTLRGGKEEIRKILEKELQDRLQRAGIKVIEARISHLAYAREIAETMLKRQQAKALVAAQHDIVDGALGVVEKAIEKLDTKGQIELSKEQKAQIVTNLLVVLCGEKSGSPSVVVGV